MKQAVILAGGKGTRLKERLGDLPKPLIKVGGKSLLEHQIELAKRYGVSDILIFTCYRPDLIAETLGDGSRWGIRITYRVETEPLGTAGAVLAGFEALADAFVVFYGDTMVNVDLHRLWDAHKAARADATLLLHPNDHPFDSDLVETDAGGWITAFHNRPHPPDVYFQNLVNAGLYVLEKRALAPWLKSIQMLDFGKDVFPAMLQDHRQLFGYSSPEYIKDIGTPERHDRVCAEFERGIVQRSSLDVPQTAVFLDRDGTLNREMDGVTSAEQLTLLPGVAEAIHLLNHHGLRAVVVTNQPVIAKGFCSEADVKHIHNKLESLLGREHAFLDRIYVCPHHPEKGFAGERPELKIQCDCRKPNPGLFMQAAKDLNINLRDSWFIGDTTTDLLAARNAGVKAVLVRTGYAGKDGKFPAKPDFTFESLKQAVEFIVTQPPAT
jgi:histidinol-phosphate phosphatase family protein